MSRTQGRFDNDTPQPDGQLSIPGTAFVNTSAGATSYTRIGSAGSGTYTLHLAASATAYQAVSDATALLRSGVQDFLQEEFGSNRASYYQGAQGQPIGQPITYATASTVAGSLVSVTVQSTVGIVAGTTVLVDTVASGVQEYALVTSITSGTVLVVASLKNSHTALFPIAANPFTTPAGVSGIPPFTGSLQLTPVTSARPKGLLIKSLTINYLVGTSNITSPTIGITATSFSESAAPVVTTLLANATNGLIATFQATPHAVTIPVPIANQNFLNVFNTFVNIEFDFTTGTSGTVDIYGATLGVSYNYL